MQGTVVMLLALSGLGCHHKKCEPAYSTACYTSCYSSASCYSTTSCYSSSQCYSSSACYSTGYSSCYSSCYSGVSETCYSSSCYSAKKHKHGLFGHKKRACGACYAEPVTPACDTCGTYSGAPVYGTYTPSYSSSQMPMMATEQMAPVPAAAMAPPTPPTPPVSPAPIDAAPPAPPAPPTDATIIKPPGAF